MAEPVTPAEAKAQCRILSDDEDALIGALIIAAREWVENFTGLVLVERIITERFASFCNPLVLRSWPIAEDASVLVSYIDGDGVSAPVSGAVLATGNRSAAVGAPLNSAWPSSTRGEWSVSVTVVAGYPTPADVPQSLKHAMLLLIGHWFANREAVSTGAAAAELPMAVESLARPYRQAVIG